MQSTELIRAATGWNMSDFELMKVGERALALARVFNTREGFVSKDDRVAERTHGPTTDGALAKGGVNRKLLQKAIKTYYGMIGWKRNGIPSKEKLEELDIAWAAKYL
jgi:aldehyde:ferredoxin oxidoreductase